MLQEGLARFGQADAAGAAVEQAGLQSVFNPGNLAADGEEETPRRVAAPVKCPVSATATNSSIPSQLLMPGYS